MEFFFAGLAEVDLYIEYVVVKLDTVDESLRSVENSILYNYFSWQSLKGPLTYFPAVRLVCDRRNREYHRLLKFDGYIEGQAAITRAEKGRANLDLEIRHYHWKSADEFSAAQRAEVQFGVRGIEAADFVCWAIKSRFENNDPRWLALIEKKIRRKQFLFFTP